MTEIRISKGLNIPIEGNPEGRPQQLVGGGEAGQPAQPEHFALNLESFDIKFQLIAKVGDKVKIGQPIAEDKATPGRMFVAPAAGVIKEIQRGLKRVIRNIVIEKDQGDKEEEYFSFPSLNYTEASREQILDRLKEGGIFAKIRRRPFDLLADPNKLPRSIFIKAIESAPFTPPQELQVEGYEKEFQLGCDILSKLTDGKVHLIYRHDTTFKPFLNAKNVVHHTAEGPHPIANPSVHIQAIDPIRTVDAHIWTLTAHDVVAIGHLLMHNKVLTRRIVAIAGPGVLHGKTGYFTIRDGFPISALVSGRIPKGTFRLVSGDPLMGHTVNANDFLGFNDTVFTVIPENRKREFLHFFRLGGAKYSYSRAYLSGHRNNSDREYYFTTSLHGEPRAFIDPSLADKLQPLKISNMMLVKAIMAEDFESAETLGLLEVAPEDFALPTFVCPSKVEMVEVVKLGLARYAKEVQ